MEGVLLTPVGLGAPNKGKEKSNDKKKKSDVNTAPIPVAITPEPADKAWP